jgi:hypothetical protein
MLCQGYYKDGVGRPSIPPGRYFRMLFVGQFEGLVSERKIAWRWGTVTIPSTSSHIDGKELKALIFANFLKNSSLS